MTANEIIRGALELCGVQGAAEPISAEDAELSLKVLNRVLALLPTYGFSWPNISSADTSITWSVLTQNTFTTPTNYFGVPVLRMTDASGNAVPLTELTKPEYDALPNKALTATYPTHFYLTPSSTFILYPVPTQDPQLKLSYQSVVTEVGLTDTPTVSAIMQDMIEHFLANEIALKFEVPEAKRIEIAQRFKGKRELALQWAVSTAPIVIEVAE